MTCIHKYSHICCNTHRQTLAENIFCSGDKEQGKTRRRNIKIKKKKSNAFGLADLSNFSFHCRHFPYKKCENAWTQDSAIHQTGRP